jgi:hypothetical protein
MRLPQIQKSALIDEEEGRLRHRLNEPRPIDCALAELIVRRNEDSLPIDRRAMLDRMIKDLEAEVAIRATRSRLAD